jgi:hypothetical protein
MDQGHLHLLVIPLLTVCGVLLDVLEVVLQFVGQFPVFDILKLLQKSMEDVHLIHFGLGSQSLSFLNELDYH